MLPWAQVVTPPNWTSGPADCLAQSDQKIETACSQIALSTNDVADIVRGIDEELVASVHSN
jgi:hypothetical protein